MSFESSGVDNFSTRSPGGFEFGIQGWTWGPPIPKSITFFLDGSCSVADQYGRQIRRAVTDDGRELRFADTPPEANKDGDVIPRPQFATHMQTLQALAAERIDWLAYEVRYRDKQGQNKMRGNLTLLKAGELQTRLLQEGNTYVIIDRTIACAGWPQLDYDALKKLPELPPTPIEELRKIRDPELRRDALRVRREVDSAREKELAATEDE